MLSSYLPITRTKDATPRWGVNSLFGRDADQLEALRVAARHAVAARSLQAHDAGRQVCVCVKCSSSPILYDTCYLTRLRSGANFDFVLETVRL